jgi:nitrite reductase/ring-hydroxylating ferredoxin subunit
MWCAIECFGCGVWEQERLNINVLLGVKNNQNAEKNVCFYWEFRSRVSFLKEDQQMGKVLCSIWKSQFSIEHGGRADILHHIKKRKHAIAAETKVAAKK